ncbi:hypothetical protein COY87_00050 [Candidatus Roizmanbacteria bacterium CG_4_10_14_0_8_um_filter_33_9]|uniref:ATPase AAA-type core domain-containing protein n=1 Tax=Candidatus Roizmanbacteria bacterium CG_4_10_14_0_8_um_filter_33_9 TaxID=1974826 RepID=A0A2M7QJV3_9BACT|nr:MAG: hypothetical protein COY87_00050 [Candidatus Roizmanbacteria bacterium CG_4_10_14_0_8_um_filter_33_9]
MDQYSKGSNWGRWELHTHTIIDDNYLSLKDYYQKLKKEDQTKWNTFTKKVGGEKNALLFDSKEYFNDTKINKKTRCVDYVRNFFAYLETYYPEIKCVGITDHNYDDNKLLDEFLDYSKKNKIKIIPGVEINAGGAHALVFFSKIPYAKVTFSEGINTFLTKIDINNKKTNSVLTVTQKNIKEIIDTVKRIDGLLIFAHCNSTNGLFQQQDKTNLADIFNYQKVCLLEERSLQACLETAEYITTNKKLKSDICFTIGCDSRSLIDIGSPDPNGNQLWIKADPTFLGLKQIIFEPKDRVKITQDKPEQKKTYSVIDKVRFIDNTGKGLFSSDYIELNQNLNAIIGGRSTGKSLLLFHIAYSIDFEEVENRFNVLSSPIDYHDLKNDANFDFEVVWSDGVKNTLKNLEDIKRKILYIPQNYLNKLSENQLPTKQALNNFIKNVIIQDKKINKTYFEKMSFVKNTTAKITTEINNLFILETNISSLKKNIVDIGDEKGITNYIGDLKKQMDELKKESGFTDIQMNEIKNLNENKNKLQAELVSLRQDKETVDKLFTDLESRLVEAISIKNNYFEYLINKDIKEKIESDLKWVYIQKDQLKINRQNINKSITEKIEKNEKQIATIDKKLSPLLKKIKLQEKLKKIIEKTKEEEAKKAKIQLIKNDLEINSRKYKDTQQTIIKLYEENFKIYKELQLELKKGESQLEDINLNVSVTFRNKEFNEKCIDEFINKHDLKRIIPCKGDEEFEYMYDEKKHFKNIEKIFIDLMSQEVNTIKNRSKRDAVLKLFEDYFDVDFYITYKGDPLNMMSPGKKSLVLLKLLIYLSREDYPILLDQPEGDLDNRSVYLDLVKFIKEKKKSRQIIIITHNPNLVVGADAEDIIVGNQRGQDTTKENKKFQFEYVSGALEKSFKLDKKKEPFILYQQGIREHVCDILEGGEEAFEKRELKYDFPRNK